jgi:hypothetical protein
MKRALCVLTLVAICLLGAVPARPDDEPPAPDARPAPVTDPAQVSTHYREILQKPEFQDSGEVDMGDQLREIFKQWFFKLGKSMSQFKYAGQMLQVASMLLTGMVILCLVGFIYVIVRVYRRRVEFKLDEAGEPPGQKTFRSPEFYDKEIQEAVQAGDWHAAWLAAWRQFLSRLENRQLVEADRTRTNREYLAQLHERSLPSPAPALLGSLVDAYDRFIYGRRRIAEPDWNLFQQQIGEAGLLLHLGEQGRGPKPAPP